MQRTIVVLREMAAFFFLFIVFSQFDGFLRNFFMFRNDAVVSYNMYLEFLKWPLGLFFVFFSRVYLGVLCRKVFMGVNPPERSEEDKKRYRIRFSLLLVLCFVLFYFSFTSRDVLLNDASVKSYNFLSQQTDEKTIEDYDRVTLSCDTDVWISSRTGRTTKISTIYYEFDCGGTDTISFDTENFRSEESVFAVKEVFSEKLTYFPEREISPLEFESLEEYYLYKDLFPHSEEENFEEDEDEHTGTTYYDFGLN